MTNIDKEYRGYGRKEGGNHLWDFAIEPKLVYEMANKVLRKNGRMVLFSQEPYTTKLISEAHPNVPFNYRAIWEKDNFANALLCNKAMVGYFEDVLVFSKRSPKHDFEGFHPLRPYFRQVLEFIGLTKKAIIDKIGQGADHTFRTDSTQFSLCTEKTYIELLQAFSIDQMLGFLSFHELKNTDVVYRQKLIEDHNRQNPMTFNLWEGKKYKSNILRYRKDYEGLHPTQKPVALFEDLIKTFSNAGDLVLDMTAGSGTTAIACLNTNRNYIVMEKDPQYFQTITDRITKWHESHTQIAIF